MMGAEGPPERELYAVLHVAPDASDEEIRRAYRHWAQVYHPDKYQAPQMKEIATDNFQRIREAYEILSDEQKRVIYDIYGMEGINSGLELGPRLSKVEELKEEIERLKRRKEEEMSAFIRPTGSLHAGFSVPRFLNGDSLMRGMAMSTEVQSQISKRNTISISGNMAVTGNAGGGAATAMLRHQISSVASIEFMAAVGLKSLLGVQTTRHLSAHSTATTGVTVSLRDGSVNLSNVWTRQLSESSNGNIQLVMGLESSIAIGWYRKTENSSASGQIKLGTNSFGTTGHYTHHLSSKSHARIAGRIGSSALELEIGAGRKISDSSTFRVFYTIGIQGISWKFEFQRAGQKLIIPVLLSRHLSPYIATGALVGPALLYFLLKKFVVKPYCLKRERQKKLEMTEKTSVQIKEARTAAEKAQQLLQNVSSRKMKKQLEMGGLVITKAYYGNEKAVQKMFEGKELDDDLASQVLDVTIPLNFLVNDLGQLKLHDGIKKAGIMGFCDLCPGDSKQLLVEYNKGDAKYMVVVDDYAELVIPQEDHRVER